MKKGFSKFLFLAAITSLILPSCSKESDNTIDEGGKTEIRLSSSIISHLRSSSEQNTQIAAGETIALTVEEESNPANILYNNIEFTADGSGALNAISKLFYPTSGNKVTIYACHPRYPSSMNDLDTPLRFGVSADQIDKASYLRADLLYAKKTGISMTNEVQVLTFKHLLSKLTFTIKKGEGASLEGLSSVEIQDMLPDTYINLRNGSIAEASGEEATIQAYGVPNSVSSTAEEVSGIAAIVAPQKVEANKELLKITIGGIEYIYKVPKDLVYESGKVYNYTITVNMAGINVSSEIVDWKEGENIEGNGTIK